MASRAGGKIGAVRYAASKVYAPIIALGGDASAVASATGAFSTFTGVAAAAANESAASGDLSTFTGIAGGAAVESSASADLNTVQTVVIAEPIYFGVGSLFDPRHWYGASPKAGDIVAFETRNGFNIASNGEISALVESGEFAVQYFDGVSIYNTSVTLSAFSVDASAEAGAGGDLSSGVALAGGAVVDATVAAALTTAIQFTAAAANDASAAADATTGIAFEGGAQAQAGASGDATTAIPLQGDAVAAADASGGLSGGIGFAGSAAAQQSASGDVDTAIEFAGDSAAAASAGGNLGVGAGLHADAVVDAGASGGLTTSKPLEGGDGAQADASGALDTAVALSGDAAAVASAAGGIDTGIAFAGDAVVVVDAPAALTDQIIVGDYLVASSITLVPGGDVAAVPGMLPIYIDNESRISITITDGGGNPITSGRVEVTLYTKPSATVSGVTWPVTLTHQGDGVWSAEIDAMSLVAGRAYIMHIAAFAGQQGGLWRVRGDWRIRCRAKYRGLRA